MHIGLGSRRHRANGRRGPTATDGRSTGRWDDPDGVWRTLYLGDTRMACYLEVLAFARRSRYAPTSTTSSTSSRTTQRRSAQLDELVSGLDEFDDPADQRFEPDE